MPKILISDKLSPAAAEIFRTRGLEVDFKPGLSKEELLDIIEDYDGLAIRSATRVSPKVLDAAARLKVVGRAGIGVDNVDVEAATAKGVVVMNTPHGNAITTAEHALALMMALARQIPQANSSTHAGRWEKTRFMGVELTGKSLGLIGCGNIGSVVASRAQGLKMKVLAYDPFLSEERAQEIGVTKVDLEELLARADIISLHVPLTDQTRNILSREALAKTNPGVRIVNCARGGLIDEEALKDLLDSGHIAGAALDVFAVEPAQEHPLFNHEAVIMTPHLGAATAEAQEKVALQIAEQMTDYLLTGAVQNAVNMPSVTAEEAPVLKPYVRLAEQLGLFGGQLCGEPIKGVAIEFEGEVANLNTRTLTAAALTGVLKPQLSEVNMVSAPSIAKQRGIKLTEVRREQQGVYGTYIRVNVETASRTHSVAGTIFSSGQNRIIQVEGISLDALLGQRMLLVTNEDRPGFIGALGTLLGDAGINIASFHLGRRESGGAALALIEVDNEVEPDVLERLRALNFVRRVKPLRF